jgi:predicted O-methyltransferase YrrM
VSLMNCGHCGKLILQDKLRMNLCYECFSSQEEQFQLLKDAMRANPSANVMQLSTQTGISTTKIMYWVRDGRIHLG